MKQINNNEAPSLNIRVWEIGTNKCVLRSKSNGYQVFNLDFLDLKKIFIKFSLMLMFKSTYVIENRFLFKEDWVKKSQF